MAYQIDRYNNTTLATVEDGTVDQTTDLKFIGKNYAGYGEIQNENFLFLLENFSGTVAPSRPLSGQVWFDSGTNKLKFYDGNSWRATGGAIALTDAPTGQTAGDFWWDAANDQLYVYNGSSFILVGPQNAGEGVTQMISREFLGDDGATYSIIASTVEDQIVAIISPSEFTIDPSNAVAGFDVIHKGVTLVYTEDAKNGVTNDGANPNETHFWGTASNADRLGGAAASEYVRKATEGSPTSFTGTVEFANGGLAIGDNVNFKLTVDPTTGDAKIANDAGTNSKIIFQATNPSGTLTDVAYFSSLGLIPSQDNVFDIGTSSLRWKNIYGVNLKGTADQADLLRYGTGLYAQGSQTLSNNTIAVRTADGNIVANLFQGTATSARYADLAEKYSTAEELAPGTVVTVCTHEDHEVEAASRGTIAIGVVSTDPAVMMNSEADGQYIGLKGRLPVRIIGTVNKGDAVYVDDNGCASTAINGGSIVGVALESNSDEGEKLVECVLKV
jgi:hypothetical protein